MNVIEYAILVFSLMHCYKSPFLSVPGTPVPSRWEQVYLSVGKCSLSVVLGFSPHQVGKCLC